MPGLVERLSAGVSHRYRLGPKIGHGGMATVYRAEAVATGDRVAIKVLHAELGAVLGPERFLREIQIAGRLRHPAIVPLIDSGDVDGALYFVMPLIEGENLRERLRREIQLPVDEAIRIAGAVAAGLQYAHEQGVVHRDIKPENILLDGDRVMIADFGVARVADSVGLDTLSSTGIAVGTPTYMSPEQSSGTMPVDRRTDIYALGCVLYEMLAGEPPFTGATAQAVAARHLVEPPRTLRVVRPGVPPFLEATIECALAKVPADRFQSAAEFLRALQDEGTPGRSAATRAVTGRARPGSRARRRWVAAAAAGAGLVVLAFAARGLLPRPAARTSDARYLIAPFPVGATDSVSEVGTWLRQSLARWNGIELGDLAGDVRSLSARASGAELVDAAIRAGAGRLIVGDVTPRADTTVLSGSLYALEPVRRLIRQVVLYLPHPARPGDADALLDSLLVPVEARVPAGGRLGSRSVPALEAFARGRLAVDRWRLSQADSAFSAALGFDGQFARANLWLALVRSWRGDHPAGWRVAAEHAAASPDLPPAERLMARAAAAVGAGNLADGCPAWAQAVERAPDQFATWFSWASCLNADQAVIPDPTSVSEWRFRSSYHQAVQAYLQSFRLLPAINTSLSSGAFRPLRRTLLTAETDTRPGESIGPEPLPFAGYPVLDADTLLVVPYPRAALANGLPVVMAEPHRAAVRYARRLFAEIARAWVAADATSADANLALAIGLQLNHDPEAMEALATARKAAKSEGDVLRTGAAAVWIGIQTSTPDDPAGMERARALADSLLTRFAADPAADLETVVSLATLTGRANLAAEVSRRGPAAEVMALQPALAREGLPLLIYAATGGPEDSLRAIAGRVERAIEAATAQGGDVDEMALRLELLGRPASLAFPEVVLPAVRALAKSGDYVLDAQAALLAGDSAGAVDRLRQVVSSRQAPPSEVPLDAVYSEARLAAAGGDPQLARRWLEPVISALALAPPHVLAEPARAGALVRSLILGARLARATGSPEVAARYAGAARILWRGADPDLARQVRELEP